MQTEHFIVDDVGRIVQIKASTGSAGAVSNPKEINVQIAISSTHAVHRTQCASAAAWRKV